MCCSIVCQMLLFTSFARKDIYIFAFEVALKNLQPWSLLVVMVLYNPFKCFFCSILYTTQPIMYVGLIRKSSTVHLAPPTNLMTVMPLISLACLHPCLSDSVPSHILKHQ